MSKGKEKKEHTEKDIEMFIDLRIRLEEVIGEMGGSLLGLWVSVEEWGAPTDEDETWLVYDSRLNISTFAFREPEGDHQGRFLWREIGTDRALWHVSHFCDLIRPPSEVPQSN